MAPVASRSPALISDRSATGLKPRPRAVNIAKSAALRIAIAMRTATRAPRRTRPQPACGSAISPSRITGNSSGKTISACHVIAAGWFGWIRSR